VVRDHDDVLDLAAFAAGVDSDGGLGLVAGELAQVRRRRAGVFLAGERAGIEIETALRWGGGGPPTNKTLLR
jgi:hypothetical protein